MLPAAGCRASSLRVVLLWVDSAGILITGRRGDHHDQRRARPDAGPRWGRGHYSEDGGSWWDETSRRWFLNRHAGHPGDPLRVRSLRPPAAQRLAGRRFPLPSAARRRCGRRLRRPRRARPGRRGSSDDAHQRPHRSHPLLSSEVRRWRACGSDSSRVKMLAWPSTLRPRPSTVTQQRQRAPDSSAHSLAVHAVIARWTQRGAPTARECPIAGSAGQHPCP
jgi:hypothetical protein